MQAIIQFIIERWLWLWPFFKVNQWQWGLVVRNGKVRRVVRGGLFFKLWGVDEVFRWPATETSIDLPSGGVTTKDNQPISFSGNLSYRVTDMALFYTKFWNTETTLRNIMIGILCSACAKHDWTYLCDKRDEFEVEQIKEIQELADDDKWGVAIVRFNITDMVSAPAQRHYFDGSLPTKNY